jgi:hypothetical protein
MASGTRPTGADLKPVPKANDGKRNCPVCGDRLSSYNPGPNCYQHTVGMPWRSPTGPARTES